MENKTVYYIKYRANEDLISILYCQLFTLKVACYSLQLILIDYSYKCRHVPNNVYVMQQKIYLLSYTNNCSNAQKAPLKLHKLTIMEIY
ncbi:hypothetical protein V1477_007601 [Vespula maculifrons]|uniref:Uncharacterized protein n=1 Tax=Vespula maculifrons TaxID=7453 RepID=A0ABD2CGA8_VESMC